ncbi:hypothetical protein GCM10009687_15520 [Asanoa iriomotensis]|uniref:Uncharacterized protein n=1 Tax=Asanoa iriomotensis TaxID=234613 RepID=A0ABQ4C0E4_9ACTN|nr:hypothetical protein Air01nite_23440 [Asanoa iriomotensis]
MGASVRAPSGGCERAGEHKRDRPNAAARSEAPETLREVPGRSLPTCAAVATNPVEDACVGCWLGRPGWLTEWKLDHRQDSSSVVRADSPRGMRGALLRPDARQANSPGR